MSTLSTSIYGSSSNKGVGGLLSGLDTDELVKQMTSSTRNKINTQYQAKQKLLYRQEAYREISSKLLTFSDKYFSFSSGSKTNILSSNFFQSYTYKSSSSYVNVSGSAENIKNFQINSIEKVATAASFTTGKVSGGSIETKVYDTISSLAGESMTLEFELDGKVKSHSITISSDFGKEGSVKYSDVVDEINKQLKKIEGNEELNILKYELDIKEIKDEETGEVVTKEYKIILDQSANIKNNVKLTSASSNIKDILAFEVGKDAVSQNEINDEGNLTLSQEDVFKKDGAFIEFEYNGVKKKINLDSSLTDAGKTSEYIQTELNKVFGMDKIKGPDGNETLEKRLIFKYENGLFQLSTAKNTDEETSTDTNTISITSISKDLGNLTGLKAGDSNRLNTKISLKDLGLTDLKGKETEGSDKETYQININGETVDLDNSMSITDIMNKINNNPKTGINIFYSNTTDTFSVRATETGSHTNISITDKEGNLAAALFGNYTVSKGIDTVMNYTLNGVKSTITRSTANFKIDDINIELNQAATGIKEPVTFEVINNADEVVEKVKEFVDAYNEIIDLIGTKTREKPNRSYQPLTPEQQDAMEEEEIKRWTEQAKKGILFGDRNMSTLLRKMRSAMSGITDVSSLTLANIGISSASMDTSGKLMLDEKKFREKLLENPQEISNLFTGTSGNTGTDARQGISYQLQSILRENIGAFGTSGLLIDEAGMANRASADRNFISEKIEKYDDKMKDLRRALEDEQNRYWRKFSALEKSLNSLNSQSSFLTGMMG